MAKTRTTTLTFVAQDSAVFHAHDGFTDYLLIFKGPRGGRYMLFTTDKTLYDKAMNHRKNGARASFATGAYDSELGAYRMSGLAFC